VTERESCVKDQFEALDAQMRVSVVIPTYNRAEGLRLCLRSLEAQTIPTSRFEVVVVDDGSADGTLKMLHGLETRLDLRVVAVEHLGPSHARNCGINAARYEILALTEDDVVVSPRWLERALAHIDDGADVVDGRVVYVGSNRSVRKFEPDEGRQPAFIPCNLIMRRSVYDAVGGYDPRFFDGARSLYFREDSDFGFRILDAGYNVQVAGDAVVEHPEQFSTFRDALRHTRRYELDALLYRKHPVRYRSSIEVRVIGGLRVARPMHYVCCIYGLSGLLMVVCSLMDRRRLATLAASIMVSGSLAYRGRYQGWRSLALWRVGETVSFGLLPAAYLGAVLRGARRFRAFGVLR
jgi:glycosyltransferase involved in cell wall biosynthesis